MALDITTESQEQRASVNSDSLTLIYEASMKSLSTPLTGIIPLILTPLNNGSELDTEGLKRLIYRMIDGGVQGLFALGTTGEAPHLPHRL